MWHSRSRILAVLLLCRFVAAGLALLELDFVDRRAAEDQVAAVNTDHRGHEGTVMVRETGTFWLDMESWSERTEWEIEACYPAEGAG